MKSSKIIIFTDGGARGNPGPAAVAFVAEMRKSNTETERYEEGICIGEATNNQAEYQAVIEALKWVKAEFAGKDPEVDFYLDSQLIVEQLNQRYKLKNEGLKLLFWEVRELVLDVGGKVSFSHVTREKNKEADRLVNEALDGVIGKSQRG